VPKSTQTPQNWIGLLVPWRLDYSIRKNGTCPFSPSNAFRQHFLEI